MRERRLEHRFAKRLTTTVEVKSTPGSELPEGTVLDCETIDISLNGVCLDMDSPLPANSQLHITINFTDTGASFNVLGSVIWSAVDQETQRYKTGVHLLKLPGDRASWNNAVLQLLVC